MAINPGENNGPLSGRDKLRLLEQLQGNDMPRVMVQADPSEIGLGRLLESVRRSPGTSRQVTKGTLERAPLTMFSLFTLTAAGPGVVTGSVTGLPGMALCALSFNPDASANWDSVTSILVDSAPIALGTDSNGLPIERFSDKAQYVPDYLAIGEVNGKIEVSCRAILAGTLQVYCAFIPKTDAEIMRSVWNGGPLRF